MADTLDLAILDAGPKVSAVVFARYGSDVAISSLPFGNDLKALLAFRMRIDRSLKSIDVRPLADELSQFGQKLFNYIIRGDVKDIYQRLPRDTMVRLSILSNRSDLKSLPWEYLQDPGEAPGPWLARSVARIVPTRRGDPPPPLPLNTAGRKLKILFVFADPVDQEPISWTNVRDSVERALRAQLIPMDSYNLKVIDGNPKDLTETLQDDTYDIFHFSDHADVDEKERAFYFF